MAAGEKCRQVAVVEQADAECRLKQQVAFFVEMDRLQFTGRCAGMADEGLAFAAEDPRGVGQRNEHPLRAVLQKPAA